MLTSCRGEVGVYGEIELPRSAGEASGPLKILRNCLFPTPQEFLDHVCTKGICSQVSIDTLK